MMMMVAMMMMMMLNSYDDKRKDGGVGCNNHNTYQQLSTTMASRIAVKKNTPTNTYNPAEKLNTLSANTALDQIGLVWIAQKTASSSGQPHKGT